MVEAVAHCRHILNQYPRHVATYRLLGKAFLEQQRFSSAVDVFQRVLSADPEDFIAHIGLSIAYKAEQLQAQAIWHMERAFELDPYNAIIQEELKALYAQRDGIAPERLSLTPGALARLHYRSGLYPQAIAAARELLATAPSRVDLQALLAEALWRDDQRVDAVEICLDLLETLPNCIKANAILAEVWLLTGRTKEAHDYLQRLQPLTLLDRQHAALETPVGSAFHIEGTLPLPDLVMVEELDDADLILEEEAAAAGVDWVSELTRLDASGDLADADWFDEKPNIDWFKAPEPAPAAAAAAVPDWLREISEETGVDLFAPDLEPTAAASPPELTEADVPGFLQEMEGIDEPEPGQSEEVVAFTPVPPVPPVADLDADFADWLDQTLVEHGDGEPVAAVITPAVLSPAPEMLANLPDWLREPESENAAPPADLLTPPAAAVDFWQQLAAMAEQEDETLAEPEFEVREMNENDDPRISQPEMPDEDVPDLTGDLDALLAAESVSDMETVSAAETGSAVEIDSELDEIPDWLQDDLDSQEVADALALPDWLQPPPSDADLEDAELPGWLKTPSPSSAAEPMPEPPSPDTDAANLTWLDEIAAGKGAALEEPLTLRWPDAAPAADGGAPVDSDWLADLEAVDWENESGEAADESVDWLAEMAAVSNLGEDEGAAADQTDIEDIFADVPDDPEAAMAWLEQLAARQGAPLAELPTMTEATPAAAPSPAAELAAAEMDVAAEVESAAEPTAIELAEAEMFASQIPEDPEAAMAWLEQLAARQGAPLDELPTIGYIRDEGGAPTAAEPASAAIEEPAAAEPVAAEWLDEALPVDLFAAQIPDDPEAAIAWLEQLAARQGAPLAELPTLAEWPEPAAAEVAPADVAQVEPAAVGEVVKESAPTLVEMSEAEAFAAQIPEDPEEAMAWLEKLAARQGAPLAELPTLMAEPEPPLPETTVTAAEMPPAPAAAPRSVLDEAVPDNSAAALAWLVRLALLDDDAEEAAAPAAAPESLAAPTMEEDLDWLLTELPAEPALPTTEPVAELPTPTRQTEALVDAWAELSEPDLAESLPDWLSAETLDGDTSWLDDLEAGDLDNWLMAEEEALEQGSDFVLPPLDVLPTAAVTPPPAAEIKVEAALAPEPIALPAAEEADLDMAKLNQARAAVDAGNIAEALTLYRSLIEQGAGLSLIVPDLEAASSRHRRQPLLRRLLGDAYMQQGELQKALNIYREVMDYL